MNQYSQVVKPADFVQPIDTNLLLKGAVYGQEQDEKNLKTIQDGLSTIYGIPAYGKDREKLQGLQDSVRQQIDSLAKNDLNNPQTMSTVKSLIRSVANSPDVQNIAQRAYTFADMQKEHKEAIKKGEQYFNPGYEEAQKYYSGQDYIKDKNFNNNGFIGLNLAKERGEVLKDIPKVKKQQIVNGRIVTTESYDDGALKEGLKSFYSDPRIARQINYNLEQHYNGTDWQQEATGHINGFLQTANNNLQKAQYLLAKATPNTPEYNAYLNGVHKYQDEVDKFGHMLQDPSGLAESYKKSVYDEKLNEQINADILHSQFYSMEGVKADEFALDNQRFAHDIAQDGLKPLIQGANAKGYTLDEVLKDPKKRVEAQKESQKLALEQFKAKEDVKLENFADKEDIKQENKKELLDSKVGSKLITDIKDGKYKEDQLKNAILANGKDLGDDSDNDIKYAKIVNGNLIWKRNGAWREKSIPLDEFKEVILGSNSNDENNNQGTSWEWQELKKRTPIEIKTQEDFDSLPIGSLFIDPNDNKVKKKLK
jgi:hypothetical protein